MLRGGDRTTTDYQFTQHYNILHEFQVHYLIVTFILLSESTVVLSMYGWHVPYHPLIQTSG